MKKIIAIIGAGNMGQAIAQGLLREKIIKEDQLLLTNSKTKNNRKAVEKADVIILAVKPYMLEEILLEIKDVVREEHLIISVAAGVTIKKIFHFAQNDKFSVVRVMPNLAAQAGESMSVWVADQYVTDEQKKIVVKILSAIGVQIEVKIEDEIDKATAISGSGPAYVFYIVEQLENAAISLGFSPETAKQLAAQTLIGASEILKNSEKSAAELRKAVTSKGGTTEAAISVFDKKNIKDIIFSAVEVAFIRAKELGK